MNYQQLDVAAMPLVGKHLIEASAGTGKTYNITRLYLRLLLEQQLTVEQILVMTFTKDATEEIRARIDREIRIAISRWDHLSSSEHFFIELAAKIDKPTAMQRLKQALLYLDDAAIFTIHGFCKRVLSQYAFDIGIPFTMDMESDCSDMTLAASRDWYRNLATKRPQDFLLLSEFWPTPESFLASFSRALSSDDLLAPASAEDIIADYQRLAKQCLDELTAQQPFLFEHLVMTKKGAEQVTRQQEYQQLIDALTLFSEDRTAVYSPIPVAFADGRRYSRSKVKLELVAIFSTFNQLKQQAKYLPQQVAKAEALTIVCSGLTEVNKVIEQQKRLHNKLSFDDLIVLLASALKQNDTVLAKRLFEQYPVALIDEFQDTDPHQFAILQAIYFTQNDAGLFLIGDPKQAIYGFRGGDVFAYLAARQHCDFHWAMDTNWRSSEQVIAGYNRLFSGNNERSAFDYGIDYQSVKASSKAASLPILADDKKALQLVYFDGDDYRGRNGKVGQQFRPVMATWCAQEISLLLAVDQISAKDIAILVRDGGEAEQIKQALTAVDIASVYLSDRADLYHSEQAQQLLVLLKAVYYLENDRLFTAALASQLLNYYPERLQRIQAEPLEWQELKYQFADLRNAWQRKGFIAMALQLLHQHILVTRNKDRSLTNIIHLFELLQQASQQHQQPTALLYWFERHIADNEQGSEAELRLESDENLIKIVTQHGSKGLEYPVVFVPFACRWKDPLKAGNRNLSVYAYHDEQGNLLTSLAGTDVQKQAVANEAYAESVRLLYVAVTRAEQRCYILATEFENINNSPLGKTLAIDAEQQLKPQLLSLAESVPAAIGVLDAKFDDFALPESVTDENVCEFSVPQFHGRIERNWWLSSFTGLSRNLRHGGVSSPDRDQLTVEGDGQVQKQQLRFAIAKGAHTGNLLHDILEHTDFSQPDWNQALRRPLMRYGELPDGFNQQQLINWLSGALATPLPAIGESSALFLRQLSLAQTLREAEFYYPMTMARLTPLAKLLANHRQRVQKQLELSSVATESVALPDYHQLKGMMHGFIDLIFEYQGKYYLCDYKSSYLGDRLTDYQRPKLHLHIEQNYYDLQYLIYALALHRYLASRLENYDSAQHFGGVYYLYLRGMAAEEASTGAFAIDITPDELETLDGIFSGQV